jgi:hypothetical protein
MRLFRCQSCRQALYFENTCCEPYGHQPNYLSEVMTNSALEADGDQLRAHAASERPMRSRDRNRAMGNPDLYPFVLSLAVVEKLGVVHDVVHGRPAA